jgi:hypothetical protein
VATRGVLVATGDDWSTSRTASFGVLTALKPSERLGGGGDRDPLRPSLDTAGGGAYTGGYVSLSVVVERSAPGVGRR